jgi:hypothetical protein
VGRFRKRDAALIVRRAHGPPPDSLHFPANFERGTAGVNELLKAAFAEQLQYVGEWHFHRTAGVRPSSQDRRSMVGIASDPEYRMPDPLLAIVSARKSGWLLGVYRSGARGRCEPCGELLLPFTSPTTCDLPGQR